jgi:putative hydrolase of the HAD superfamily
MIKALVFDVGGVLLTNGWDTASRELAAKTFELDFKVVEKRHQLMWSTHELGKVSLDTYLEFTYFSEKRPFTKETFKAFMFEQSKPHENMLQMLKEFKEKYSLQIGVLSNEGEELTHYRVEKFLSKNIDFFCVSAFVGMRKPDPAIFHLMREIAQKKTDEIVYIDDRKEFAQIAKQMGFYAIHHETYEKTREIISNLSF